MILLGRNQVVVRRVTSALIICLVLLTFFTTFTVNAQIICKANADCDEGLICMSSVCSSPEAEDVTLIRNPFVTGCLRTMAERDGRNVDEFKMRVCNSDDAVHGNHCLHPEFDYLETRIASWNWETALIVGWIYQILLSEVFGVPATIEGGTGVPDTGVSFYDKRSRLKYPDFKQETSLKPIYQLVEADRVDGDCSKTDKPCAHVMPEVWDGDLSTAKPFQVEGKLLPADLSGVNTRYGLYLPSHTVSRNPSFASYFGLQGNEKRVQLAETFKRPTNWSDYCELDTSNCGPNDKVASRKPETDKEGGSYFLKDAFWGYFSSNNCDTSPDTCIGNIVAPNCQWSTYIETQMFWNDISLASKGVMGNNNGYGYSHMIQIYKAANATNSDVLFSWWEPDVLPTQFASSSNYSFHRVAFPNPSMNCIKYRVGEDIQQCSTNSTLRVGKQDIGSCDAGIQVLRKLLSNGFLTSTESMPLATHSPAFDFLKALIFPPYSIENIFEYWERLREENVVADVEREGVCRYVYENIDELLSNTPKGYPRSFNDVTYASLSAAAYGMGSVTLVAALTTAALVYRWRKHAIIRNSKVNVLYLVTLGHCFIAISALIAAVVTPTDVLCVSSQWFMRLGYTLALVPILIKVSAINKLTRDGMGCRRVEINPNRFNKILAVTISILLLFLIIWTSIDMPRRTKQYEMNNENLGDVDVYVGCESQRVVWKMAAYAWEFLLLLSATVLTFQSRDVIPQLNESNSMAFIVYSHFVFVIARIVTMVMDIVNFLPAASVLKINSLLISFDALFGMVIYFGPKFFNLISEQVKKKNRKGGGRDNNLVNQARSLGRMGGGKSAISGLNLPRNSDGSIPRLIKSRPSIGNTSIASKGSAGGKDRRLRSRNTLIDTKDASARLSKLPSILDEAKDEEVRDVVVGGAQLKHIGDGDGSKAVKEIENSSVGELKEAEEIAADKGGRLKV